MTDRQDYVALDWVSGEIAESLTQAASALEDYANDRNDSSKIHFCLAYIHQVQGSLSMVEFSGAALLAKTAETVVNLLLEGKLGENQAGDAINALRLTITELPRYLEYLKNTRDDNPALLIKAFNELMAVRGQPLLSAGPLFSPKASTPKDAEPLELSEDEFVDVVRKLRQMYQIALLGFLRGHEVRKNLNYLGKVCARVVKLSRGYAISDLWFLCIALLEGLLNNSIKSGVAVRSLLRRMDTEIRQLQEQGSAGLSKPPAQDLLKDLQFYVACSEANSQYISEAKKRFGLSSALPGSDKHAALCRRLSTYLQELAVQAVAAGPGQSDALETALYSSAILGLNNEYQALQGVVTAVSDNRLTPQQLADQLQQLAQRINAGQQTVVQRPELFNNSEEAQQHLNRAYASVIEETRNGLEMAKDALVNFVANQWQVEHIADVPGLLSSLRGGLVLAEFHRPAAILAACEQFVREQLLDDPHVPDWRTLDALADALTSVDYFLERRASNSSAEDEDILNIAQRCVAALGYPVAEATPAEGAASKPSAPQAEKASAEVVEFKPAAPEVAEESAELAPEPEAEAGSGIGEEAEPEPLAEEVDPEILEIFIEEVDEVLEAINEQLPTWREDLENSTCLEEVRRAFHTLKGSGRMVNAEQVGELGWQIENMLNRVMEGRLQMDDQRMVLIDRAVAMIPDMMTAFQNGKRFDQGTLAPVLSEAEQLAQEQSPTPVEAPVAAQPPEPEPEVEAESKAVETPAADAENDDDDNLRSIFAGEARIHLQAIINFLRQAQAPAELSDALQRSLHTLKGAAHMAEMTSIAELVTPTEKLIKEMRALQLPGDVELLVLLKDFVAAMAGAVSALGRGEEPALPEREDLLKRVETLTRRLALTASQRDETFLKGVSADELNQFIVQSGEHFAALQDALQQAQLVDAARLNLLGGRIGWVADRAQSLNMNAIAELADSARHLLLQAADPIPESALELATAAAEQLMNQLNQLAGEQQPAAAPDLLERLRQYDFSAEQTEPAEDIEELALSAPAAEPEPAEEMPALVDIDPEVLALFLEESEDILEGVDEVIHRWSGDDQDRSHLEELQRHLHTLKGGARMAGLMGLGELTHNFESYIIDKLDSGVELGQDFVVAILEYYDRVVTGLAAARQGRDIPAPSAEGAIPVSTVAENREQVAEPEPSRDAVPVAPATMEVAPEQALTTQAVDIDPDILGIFLEEAEDLLEGIDEVIHRWSEGERDSEQLEELQRYLHTMKGGARLAGLSGLGQLTHNYETFIIEKQGSGEELGEEFLNQILNYQDRLAAGVAAAGQGKDVSSAAASAGPEVSISKGEAAPKQSVETGGDMPAVPKPAPAKTAPTPQPKPEQESALAELETYTPQEMIKVSAGLMENLVNLAGETSIARGRAEEQVNEFSGSLEEMLITVERLQEQVRRLDIETEAQILFRQEQVESEGQDGFDPLEFDRYSQLQQLSRSLLESASDLNDIRDTLSDKTRDMETLLLQQSRINTELQEGLMRSRMVHFSRMVPRLRRIVRQISLELGKRVEFKVYNAEGELDRQVLERIVPPLEHMLRNAVDHGIESEDKRREAGKDPVGTISMHFAREGGDVVITLADDGAGLNLEAIRRKAEKQGLLEPGQSVSERQLIDFLFQSGFSTADKVTQISGRGVGMDVVYSEIKQLGGSVNIETTQGQGTRFLIRLPFTVSVNRALMVSIGGDIYAVPINAIEGIVRVSPYELEVYYQQDAPPFEYAGQPYNLRYLGALLHTVERPILEGQSDPRPVLLVRGGEQTTAIQVDSLLGSREIVVKTLGPQFGSVHGLSGATVLGDGSVVIILDVLALLRADLTKDRDVLLGESRRLEPEHHNMLVMVVDDSVTVRKVTSRLLERQGMDVLLAKDGVDAITQLQESERLPDVMLLDIEMPRMDGFEVASRVRHTGRLKDIPIIMITSRTGQKHRERALGLGVNKYLGKPYQETTLLQAIAEVTGETIEQDG